eukprot:1161066-Pelagomonas_calceolata.AAC.9
MPASVYACLSVCLPQCSPATVYACHSVCLPQFTLASVYAQVHTIASMLHLGQHLRVLHFKQQVSPVDHHTHQWARMHTPAPPAASWCATVQDSETITEDHHVHLLPCMHAPAPPAAS